MGWSTHHPAGLIHYSAQSSYRGYTLFSNLGGHHTYLVDMEGHVCHTWRSDERIHYSYLLPNGHSLLRTGPAGQEVSFLDRPERELLPRGGRTAAGAILELDWDSNVVWAYRDPLLHHDFERLPNGNTLVLVWESLPEELASDVSGGFSAGATKGQMLGDVVRKVTPDGDTVNEWRSWEVPQPGRRHAMPSGRTSGVDPPELLEHNRGWRPFGEFPPNQYSRHS